MDTYSSGEDPVVKIRKPYTISKQRERWTDEEHNRFLEALKLHGRAWQRIEEHIGTKTAVQIRSHAQKFFSKLEKDAHVKGVPISKAIDIEIPPPRPKRKPSNPYPRKTGVCSSTTQAATKDGNLINSVSSSCPGNQTPQLGKVSIFEQPGQVEDPANSKETQNGNASDILGLFQEAPCTSESSANKLPRQPSALLRRSCSFKEFVLPCKEATNRNESNVNIESIVSQRSNKSDANEITLDNIVQGNEGTETEMQANQNYPRHVPVHIVDGNIIGSSSQTSFSDTSYQEPFFHQGHSTLFNGLSNVKKSTIHQCVPNFYPPLFPPVCDNQQDYRSFSVFSNLIISTLLQNPLAHAAASFAASICPSDNTTGFAESQIRAPPSMAAITAATVAAATAWWAAHGLLPLYNPLNTCFPCTPPGYGTDASPMDPDQAPRENTLQDQVLEGHSQLPFSSSDSEEPNVESKDPEQEKTVVATEIENDLNTAEVRKQVNPSSCGSNTPSSSEVETDALEKHNEKTMDESKDEPETGHPAGDSMNRRIRSNTYNLNEPWKEVSDEGRLAFRALFARQRLPQSFSPPPDLNNIGPQNMNIEDDERNTDPKSEKPLLLDLNSNALGFGSCQDNEKNVFLTVNSGDEGLLTIGLGQGKLKARRTGFKPYKRCSVEAKVTTDSCQGEEKGPKRIRLEIEALS